MERTYSPKYKEGMTSNDISKAIRKDLKEAFPKLKFSVRQDNGGYSTSISVEVKDFGYITAVKDKNDKYGYIRMDAPNKLIDKIEMVANAYNYDGSDIYTDYFDVRYYLNVRYSGDTILEGEEDKERIEKETKEINKMIEAFENKEVEVEEEKSEVSLDLFNLDWDLKLEEYSEKCLLMTWDTKPHKEKLKELGFKFNYALKGWIISKKKYESLKMAK